MSAPGEIHPTDPVRLRCDNCDGTFDPDNAGSPCEHATLCDGCWPAGCDTCWDETVPDESHPAVKLPPC